MLFKEFERHIKERRGVIHVGAHDGGEKDYYQSYEQVIYFEPNVDIYNRLIKNIYGYKNQVAFNYGVHDTIKTAILNISSNDGESSSILELGTHKIHHPKVHYVGKQLINLVRLDDFFDKNQINIDDFNFLNIDVQGVELNVIKSLGDSVSKLDYIYCEVNREEVYEGCSLVDDIDVYLGKFGFYRKETYWTKANWGDAFYIKTNLL